MSNFMKNARTWLGLGNDPYYDDEYGDPEFDDDELGPVDEVADDDVTTSTPPPAARPRAVASSRSGAVRAASGDWDEGEGDGGVRVISPPAPSTGEPESRGVVRPLPSASKPHVVSPTTFTK